MHLSKTQQREHTFIVTYPASYQLNCMQSMSSGQHCFLFPTTAKCAYQLLAGSFLAAKLLVIKPPSPIIHTPSLREKRSLSLEKNLRAQCHNVFELKRADKQRLLTCHACSPTQVYGVTFSRPRREIKRLAFRHWRMIAAQIFKASA